MQADLISLRDVPIRENDGKNLLFFLKFYLGRKASSVARTPHLDRQTYLFVYSWDDQK